MNLAAETKPARTSHVVYRIVDGEAVIVEPRNGLINVINEVGSRMWELIDGQRSISAIAETISDEYDVSPDNALKDALPFFDDLESKKLISLSS